MGSGIVDASAIIALCRINKIQLLEKLFGKIYIPNAVYYEVVIKGKRGAEAVKDAVGKCKAGFRLDDETYSYVLKNEGEL